MRSLSSASLKLRAGDFQCWGVPKERPCLVGGGVGA